MWLNQTFSYSLAVWHTGMNRWVIANNLKTILWVLITKGDIRGHILIREVKEVIVAEQHRDDLSYVWQIAPKDGIKWSPTGMKAIVFGHEASVLADSGFIERYTVTHPTGRAWRGSDMIKIERPK